MGIACWASKCRYIEIARRLRTKVKGVLYNDSLVILSQMCQCKVVEIKLCGSKWEINSKLALES